jgi:hypothetical protein
MTGAREERLKKGGREQIKRRKKKEKKKGEGRTGRTYHDHPPLHGRSLSLSRTACMAGHAAPTTQ